MRFGFIIVMVLVAVQVCGQAVSDISKRLLLLQNDAEFKFDASDFSSLPEFENHCDNKNENPTDYYHVTDLNNDGKSDLIYSGPCEPTGQTTIYLNAGNKLRKAGAFPGKLIAIDKNGAGSVLHILKEVCCCYPFNEFIQVTIDRDSKIAKNTITFGSDTKIRLNNRLRQEKVMGTIRTTPRVYDVPKADECKRQVYRGNQLRRVEGFKDVVQLYRAGEWWLVLYPESTERSWIGWMKLN